MNKHGPQNGLQGHSASNLISDIACQDFAVQQRKSSEQQKSKPSQFRDLAFALPPWRLIINLVRADYERLYIALWRYNRALESAL